MHRNTWQAIFSRSPANCGYYDEHGLPHVNWDWPKGTWFQARRDLVRERRPIQVGKLRESADDAVGAASRSKRMELLTLFERLSR